MTTKFDQRLQDIFDLPSDSISHDDLDNLPDDQESEAIEYELVKVEYDDIGSRAEDDGSDKHTDYQFARKTLYGVIERGMSALEGSLMVAKESEHPRAYEVASSIMNNISNMSKDLMLLHKETSGPKKVGSITNNTQINNFETPNPGDDDGDNLDSLLDSLDEHTIEADIEETK